MSPMFNFTNELGNVNKQCNFTFKNKGVVEQSWWYNCRITKQPNTHKLTDTYRKQLIWSCHDIQVQMTSSASLQTHTHLT